MKKSVQLGLIKEDIQSFTYRFRYRVYPFAVEEKRS